MLPEGLDAIPLRLDAFCGPCYCHEVKVDTRSHCGGQGDLLHIASLCGRWAGLDQCIQQNDEVLVDCFDGEACLADWSMDDTSLINTVSNTGCLLDRIV